MTTYLASTRHPWACLVFVLPLLAFYELGVMYVGGPEPTSLRNGADMWLRWGLARYGAVQAWAAPALVAAVLILRAWSQRNGRPGELLSVVFGMAVESVLFAAGLWAVARNFEPLMNEWGIAVSVAFHTPVAGQVITYIGTGIYEEVLFRLGLFSILCFLLRLVHLPGIAAVALSAAAAALLFAYAHHIGPHGEEFVPVRFLFRVLAGLYFTLLFVARGFGIAVGAHAGYDILVGVAVG